MQAVFITVQYLRTLVQCYVFIRKIVVVTYLKELCHEISTCQMWYQKKERKILRSYNSAEWFNTQLIRVRAEKEHFVRAGAPKSAEF